MERVQAISDLEFIRRTMKASTRYTNIPPMGYLLSGLFGLAGPLYTWLCLGAEKIANPALITICDVIILGVAWLTILLAAAFASAVFSVLRAKRLGKSAWNSLVARMLGSQVPLLFAAGLLTIGMAAHQQYSLIPAIWLISYGLVLFSLYFFTGKDHLIQSVIFLALGAASLFSPAGASLVLLATGFGATNLFFGVRGLLKEKEVYETGPAE
jgi:hypothetical protein